MNLPDAARKAIRRLRSVDAPPKGTTHVLQYCSPLLLNPSDRDGSPGSWEIQSLGNHEAGTPADSPPGMDGGPGTPAAMLRFFVSSVLGTEVRLTPYYEEAMVADDYPDGEWLPAPGYYIIPSGGDRR